MNNAVYTYSLLQYRHSQFLGEVLNIGILIYFHDTEKFYFECPEKLLRLKFAYPNIPEKTIKSYFRLFKDKVEEINTKNNIFGNELLQKTFKGFINSEILAQDSSALQFSDEKKGIKFSSEEDIVNQLYNQYFSVFEHTNNNDSRIDETHLLARYKNLIKEVSSSVLDKKNKGLHYDYVINPTNEKSFKFDIAWQNGSLNLVKPVSFDVKKSIALQNKAYRYYGEFLDIDEYATQHNYRFDLIIAKPSRKDLFKYFNNAIKLLSKPERVQLIFDEDLQNYSKKTAIALSLFESQNDENNQSSDDGLPF